MSGPTFGLDLDAVRPVLVEHGQDGELRSVYGTRADFPPSLIAPTSRAVPFALDLRFPARAEGAGVLLHEDATRTRVPLAYLWELFLRKPGSRILAGEDSPHREGVRIAELLANAASTLLAGDGEWRTGLCALVVPNCIQEQAQDELLRECRRLRQRSGSQAKLVW